MTQTQSPDSKRALVTSPGAPGSKVRRSAAQGCGMPDDSGIEEERTGGGPGSTGGGPDQEGRMRPSGMLAESSLTR
jgi:hypothetical protein